MYGIGYIKLNKNKSTKTQNAQHESVKKRRKKSELSSVEKDNLSI